MTPPSPTDAIIDQYNKLIEWYLLNRPHEALNIAMLEKRRENYIKEMHPENPNEKL